MKNIFLLIISLLIVAPSMVAQQKLFLTVEAGPAFPIGSFSSDDNSENGFAKTGLNAFINAAFGLNENLRVGAKVGFLSNGVKDGAFSFVDNSPWESTIILGNLAYKLPISSSLSVEAEAGVGLMRTQFPDATLTILGSQITREGALGNGLAYQFGGAMRYDLSEDFAFRLGVNYLGGKPGFEQSNTKYTQNIGLVNLNWGIMFML